jgi:1-acyl-sn-glycerol-3-phosphate acyltransferase
MRSRSRRVRAWLRAGYEYFSMVLGLGALGVICLTGLPIALVCLCLPRSIRFSCGRRLISTALSAYLFFLRLFCGVRLEASALDSLRPDRPLIIVANHPSLLDAVILLSRLPCAVCVMKGSLRRNILFGPMSRLAGYVGNDEPMQMIRQACNELAGGAHLVIFPEGTRTEVFPVNPFSEATAFLAARSGSTIQTVFLDFSSTYLGKAWPLRKKPSLPLRITVTLGRRFAPENDRTALTERLESYYRSHLMR